MPWCFAKLELIDGLSCESLAQASRTPLQLVSRTPRARRGDCARLAALPHAFR